MKDVLDLPENFLDNLHTEIGNNVKKARMKKGLSQLKLAQMIGHNSLSIISLAEIYHNHKQHFNIEHLVKIAYVLDVNLCELLPTSLVQVQKE